MSESWIGNIWDKITSLFSTEAPEEIVTPCDKSISPARAQELFDKLASQPDIPFNITPDCCYARAQKMANILADEGVSSKKQFAYGDSRNPLAPVDKNGTRVMGQRIGSPPREVTWGYHVAPTVSVKAADGTCQDMIIDPSMSDRPLTINEWEGLMGGAARRKTTDSNVFYTDSMGYTEYHDPTSNDIEDAFKGHRKKYVPQ